MKTQACDYIEVDTALDAVFHENITDVESVLMILYLNGSKLIVFGVGVSNALLCLLFLPGRQLVLLLLPNQSN